jgi:hypothetical protein
VVGKDQVELEKYLEKKFALPEEDISTLIVFSINVSFPVLRAVLTIFQPQSTILVVRIVNPVEAP